MTGREAVEGNRSTVNCTSGPQPFLRLAIPPLMSHGNKFFIIIIISVLHCWRVGFKVLDNVSRVWSGGPP